MVEYVVREVNALPSLSTHYPLILHYYACHVLADLVNSVKALNQVCGGRLSNFHYLNPFIGPSLGLPCFPNSIKVIATDIARGRLLVVYIDI